MTYATGTTSYIPTVGLDVLVVEYKKSRPKVTLQHAMRLKRSPSGSKEFYQALAWYGMRDISFDLRDWFIAGKMRINFNTGQMIIKED